jgi:hypothetical protein
MSLQLFAAVPPFTQLNTPYPSTAYIKGFLNTKNIICKQADWGLECILVIFSKKGLKDIFRYVDQKNKKLSVNAQRIVALHEEYCKTIDSVISFLQGKNPTLALHICSGDFLPQASRFDQVEELDWAFGEMGLQDKAKHLATLYLEDLSDLIIEAVDENFGFSRYAERLGRSANSFDELYAFLNSKPTYIDEILFEILKSTFHTSTPDLLLLSVPFPGNLYSAFRVAQWFKFNHPQVKIALGGGFPNTELRSLNEKRVFEFFDFVTLDDGEAPLVELIKAVEFNDYSTLKRTFLIENNQVVYKNNSPLPDFKQNQLGTPDYSGLLLDKYISVIEIVNPMHKMWSDGRWNKLTMAHGCYWGKCTFCDISLDYIKIYEPATAVLICDRMEEMIAQTGVNGFHFVDEAAPPALMKALAIEIIKRGLVVTWWTNIRFEKSFTRELCYLLKQSGCIAVSGGLEVASDRLLQLIDKGVRVEQVAKVTNNFTQSGIMVHAYLMYGYPTQTIQETIDSLEMVRQMFEEQILQSAFWHQFALTAHSPIGLNPDAFGVTKKNNQLGDFANNDIEFTDITGINHDKFSYGLKKSLFNFMHGIGLEEPLQSWFDFKIPNTKVKPNFIQECLLKWDEPKDNGVLIWMGKQPVIQDKIVEKKGKKTELKTFVIQQKTETIYLDFKPDEALFLMELFSKISIDKSKGLPIIEVKNLAENYIESFILFWNYKNTDILKQNGLLLV